MTSTAPHQALYRRWRAQTFAQIVGQEAVVETLRNAVRTDRVAHAILFVGPRGTGKTSLARILAKALNCTDLRDGDPCDACPSCIAIREGTTLDVLEIDAASNRGINEIKDLRERLQYAPSQLRRKVYILDEAHQITRDAWNALLKSLEEPPEYVVFMFASTHPQEFPPAILSRLQRYDVRRLTVDEIEGKLLRILEADERAADGAAVRLIARLAAGGMRDAESMLDQLLASSGDRLDEAFVRELLGLADAEAVEQFVAALVAGDAAVGIRILDALEERGRDARVFLDQVVEVIRARIVELVSEAGGGEAVPAVASVARRLAAIDPNRAGVGGLRLQLELALFASPSTVPGLPATERPARTPELVPHSRTAREQVAPKAVAKPRATVADPATVRTSTGSPAPAASTAVPTGGAPAVAASAPAATPASGGRADVDATAEARAASSDRPARTEAPAEPGGTGDEPATTPTPLTAVAPQPTPAGGATDLDVLRRRWPEVVAHISQHPPTKPLIAACRPISVDGNVVVLGFPEDQAFLKDVAERRRPILESGVGEFLGRPVAVRCVATNLDLVPPPAADEDAAFVLSEARRIFADDLVDVGEVS